MDGFVVAEELVVGRDVTDGAVQADVVVVLDIIGDEPARVVQGQRDLDADALMMVLWKRSSLPLDCG
jgi:hypothetical protein